MGYYDDDSDGGYGGGRSYGAGGSSSYNRPSNSSYNQSTSSILKKPSRNVCGQRKTLIRSLARNVDTLQARPKHILSDLLTIRR